MYMREFNVIIFSLLVLSQTGRRRRLPDMEGTELLTKMHRDTPKMMKIMITWYPPLENAVEAVNKGADAYIIKPVKLEEVLKVIEEKL